MFDQYLPAPHSLNVFDILHKMKQFHSKLANLQVGRCFTCLEAFPGMTSRMQASGERSPALHRRPRTRSKLLTPGIAHTFNSGGISHWADI